MTDHLTGSAAVDKSNEDTARQALREIAEIASAADKGTPKYRLKIAHVIAQDALMVVEDEVQRLNKQAEECCRQNKALVDQIVDLSGRLQASEAKLEALQYERLGDHA